MQKFTMIFAFCITSFFLVRIVYAFPTDGLVVEYLFNSNAYDTSENENNGVVSGATLTEDRFGNPNSAYNFDGIDDYIVSEKTISISGNSPRSIAAWISLNTTETAIDVEDEVGQDYIAGWGWRYGYTTGGLCYISHNAAIDGIYFHGHYADVKAPGSIINANRWYFVVFTYDGILGKIFVDGELKGTNNLSLITAETKLFIGWHGADWPTKYYRYWNGKIDDIRIYNRVLSQGDIQDLFQREDSDNDYIFDDIDNCPDTSNPQQEDYDSDDIGDDCDNCPESDNPDQANADADSFGDTCDNCPTLSNNDQADNDQDGLGDACDLDDDNDQYNDELDNCPLVENQDQTDFDGNGVGDACDDDDDGDGIFDTNDLCNETMITVSVDENGCSAGQNIDIVCPCDTNPPWKNHGKYISCITHAVDEQIDLGLIGPIEKDEIISERAQSDCGKKK